MKKIYLPVFLLILISCNQQWSEEDRSTFLGGCLKSASKEMDAQKAKDYCNCMMGKIQNKYPNPTDAQYLKYDTAVFRMGQECLK